MVALLPFTSIAVPMSKTLLLIINLMHSCVISAMQAIMIFIDRALPTSIESSQQQQHPPSQVPTLLLNLLVATEPKPRSGASWYIKETRKLLRANGHRVEVVAF